MGKIEVTSSKLSTGSHRNCSIPLHCHCPLSPGHLTSETSTLSICDHHLLLVPGTSVTCSEHSNTPFLGIFFIIHRATRVSSQKELLLDESPRKEKHRSPPSISSTGLGTRLALTLLSPLTCPSCLWSGFLAPPQILQMLPSLCVKFFLLNTKSSF